MKTFILVNILILFIGCGSDYTALPSDTTPPQPHTTSDIVPPASPTLE